MNSQDQLTRSSLLLTAVLAVALVLIAGGMGVYVLADRDLHMAFQFTSLAMEIDHVYNGQVDHKQLVESAREAMFERLDRFSGYIDKEQFNRINEEFSGAYSGIGVTVVPHEQGLLIMSVRENGPADKVGLLSGDILIAADGHDLGELGATGSVDRLRGPDGTDVRAAAYRPSNGDTVEVTITRARIPLLHIPYAGYMPDSVLYVRILDFESGASEDLKAALDSLLTPDRRPSGLILDLRGNPGGLLREAYHTANMFLDEGQFIVGTDGRSRWNEEKYYSTGADITGGIPMAVLVDGGSASAAEIVSGSLQQLGRAMLVGDKTFGKGLVQGLTRFPNGDGVRLTISRYYLANGVYLNEFDSTLHDIGTGLVPDYYVDFTERHQFPRVLENSLLLQEFANAHQDEIVERSAAFNLSDDWVKKFEEYAREQGFVYHSATTQQADLLTDLTVLEQKSQKMVAAARDILHQSQKIDMDQFDFYSGYIKTRLKQLAYERKFGSYRTYRDVIVRERPDILFTAELLKQARNDKQGS